MSDAERRKKEHAAKLGDEQAAAAVNRDMDRHGEGIVGFLREMIGKRIYIEGARINYRGTLREVLLHGDGMPGGLVLRPCQRVSYFQKNGPEGAYTYTHTEPRLVPYEMVHDIGVEAFREGTWPGIVGAD